MKNSSEQTQAFSPVRPRKVHKQYAREQGTPGARSPVRIVYVVGAAMTADFLLKGQLAFLRSQGYEVTVVASPDLRLRKVALREGVQVMPIPISRTIRPLRDILTLYRLWRYFNVTKPHIVNASTPKAGLLGMLAAFLCGVPVRIYILRGLRLETVKGIQRQVLGVCERIASWCSHRIVCVSQSLATKYASGKYAPLEKIMVLGEGSSNGVDSRKFSPTPKAFRAAALLQSEMEIPNDAFLLGFVGRMTRDKGIVELVKVFEQLCLQFPKLHLVFVGDYEVGDAADTATRASICAHPRIHVTGFVTETVPYYHLFDLLVFPSYREGFPNAVIEAHASGLPVVGYVATGTVDAVLEGKTGRLVPVGNIDGLREAITAYVLDSKLRQRHGKAARERVRTSFQREKIWHLLDGLYKKELMRMGATSPALFADQSSTDTDTANAA